MRGSAEDQNTLYGALPGTASRKTMPSWVVIAVDSERA